MYAYKFLVGSYKTFLNTYIYFITFLPEEIKGLKVLTSDNNDALILVIAYFKWAYP